MQKLDLEEAEKVLGVVDRDLYTPGLSFVFGQASLGGKACLIALARLRQEFYGLPEDEKLFYSRAVNEAVHERSHSFGLDHCKDPRCVMHFSNSLADTDYKGKDSCKDCLDRLSFKHKNVKTAHQVKDKMRIVVAYYSQTGKTKKVAGEIADTLKSRGVEVERVQIESVEDKDYSTNVREAREGVEAEIRLTLTDLSEYDVVCVGTPVWSSSRATPVNGYFAACSGLEGMKAACFAT